MARDLSKSFGEHQVVKNVSLEVESGEVVAIVGPSGAGKTTLLKLLNHLENPSGGDLLINNIPVRAQQHSEWSRSPGSLRWLRENVGMVFQEFGLWSHMSVLSNLIEAPVAQGLMKKDEAIQVAKKWLDAVDLADKILSSPETLSGGQKQRVALVRACMAQPKVLLLDEITSALDPELTHVMKTIIQDMAQKGMAVILVTHDINFARSLSNRLIFMESGSIVAEGRTESLFADLNNLRVQRFLNCEAANA